jgi:O-antigen/teichoic acid export membrane protein
VIEISVRKPDAMRSRVLRGLAWKATSSLILQISRFGVALILARLLAPHEYGLAGMVLVFASFVLVFSDLALGAALIQRRRLDEDDRSTVFWTGVGAGIVFTALGVALSGPIAEFYGEPAVRPLFAALSLTFLVTSLGTTQAALLTRDMNFRGLEIRQMTATVLGAATGIAVAVYGFGAWAIVIQQLTIASVSTALLWRFVDWRPSARFSPTSLRQLGRFSANVFGQRLLYYAGRSVDKVLVGKVLGAAALGVYGLAYNVILAPFHQIAGPIQQVLFPAFSHLQDDPARMAAVWIRVTRLVGAISIPALLGLIVVAPDFVSVVLGDRWEAASPVIRILAWVGLIQSLQTLNGDILQALNRTGILFRYTLVWFGASLTAFAVGLQWGVIGVAACYAIAATLVEPLNAYVTARALGISVWEFFRGLMGVAQAAAIMGASALAVRAVLVGEGVPAGARLIVLVVFGIAVFVPCCAWREPEAAAEVRRLLRRGTEGLPVTDLPPATTVSER